jgi:hypothetical protein
MARCLKTFAMCLMIFIWVSACTTTPKYNFPQGTRVGIINVLEPYVTHQQFSSLGSEDNFKKTYEVDWDMPSYAENQLKTQLGKDTRFTIVKIKLSEPLQEKTLRLKMIEQVLVSRTVPPIVPPQGARLLDRVSQPYDVQVVILIGSYNGPGPYRKNTDEQINVEGYGLFTRWLFRGIFGGLLSARKAYAYAQIGVVVYKVQPATYIAAARAIRKGRQLRPINDFNWNANIRNLPESELNRTKHLIEEYIDEAVKRALRNADLTTARPPREDTGVGGAPSR